jgi:hypothetical protein
MHDAQNFWGADMHDAQNFGTVPARAPASSASRPAGEPAPPAYSFPPAHPPAKDYHWLRHLMLVFVRV